MADELMLGPEQYVRPGYMRGSVQVARDAIQLIEDHDNCHCELGGFTTWATPHRSDRREQHYFREYNLSEADWNPDYVF